MFEGVPVLCIHTINYQNMNFPSLFKTKLKSPWQYGKSADLKIFNYKKIKLALMLKWEKFHVFPLHNVHTGTQARPKDHGKFAKHYH